MKYDLRCLQITIRRNTAVPQQVALQHFPGCMCEPVTIIIEHKKAVVINAPNMGNYCPCGAPKHKGLCCDALAAIEGRRVPKWQP